MEVNVLLLPPETQESVSGCQARQEVPLSAEPSNQPNAKLRDLSEIIH